MQRVVCLYFDKLNKGWVYRNILKKGGSLEIITDSYVYQKHIEELISCQNYFKQIEDFPISYQISTFNKKALTKGHTVKEYVLEKIS